MNILKILEEILWLMDVVEEVLKKLFGLVNILKKKIFWIIHFGRDLLTDE